ncbi:hypothetical protein ACS0TY_036448 [Phlomoides rotata]
MMSGYQPAKRKRNHPGMPDPNAEVIALSPETLIATNRFICEICNKGFHRDQNLHLHQRGHNMSWKLLQRNSNEEVRKRVYVCPEISCEYHHPSRALGDLTGIKKHFCRKHGEKRYKCDRCPKMYAVESDVKAHMKTCGTKDYRCECGTLFSRRDSFESHKAYCDALAPESHHFDLLALSTTASPSSGMLSIHSSAEPTENHTANKQPLAAVTWPTSTVATATGSTGGHIPMINRGIFTSIFNAFPESSSYSGQLLHSNIDPISLPLPSSFYTPTHLYPPPQQQHQHYASHALSATALLQKATQIGSTSSFLPGVWAPPPPNHPQYSTSASHSNNSTMNLGNNFFMASELGGSSLGKKPTSTLNSLGLGMEDDEFFSDGYTTILMRSINGAPPPSYGGGETWDAASKGKGPLL